MEKPDFSVVFMGNGPVAAKSLQLMHKWLNIELVITKQKPPHHKDPAPVEEYCTANNLPVFYANNKKQLEETIYENRPISAVGIVVDYGVIINPETINFFAKGIINSHFSLLPQWRGADPITYSILSGQSKSGVSLMLIDQGLDTGPILAAESLMITNQDNFMLTEQLIDISNRLLQHNLPLYMSGQLKPQPQDTKNKIITHSRMLVKADGVIDPYKPAAAIAREIRAFKQWPKSRLTYKNNVYIITDAAVSDSQVEMGSLVIHENRLLLGCKKSCLEIKLLKPAGKNEMTAAAFINGYGHLINN
jgi:methionyl-tRNA formyltransferase